MEETRTDSSVDMASSSSIGSRTSFFSIRSHQDHISSSSGGGGGGGLDEEDTSQQHRISGSSEVSRSDDYIEVQENETPKVKPLDESQLHGVELDEIPEVEEEDLSPIPSPPSSIASTTQSFDLPISLLSPSPSLRPISSQYNSTTISSGSSTHMNPSTATNCTSVVAPQFTLRSPTLSSSSCSSNPVVQDWGSNFWCIVSLCPQSSHSFFANPSTGECRWTLPSGSLVLPMNENGQWWELWDEHSGATYFYHTTTHESRWTKPEGKNVGVVIPMQAVQRSRHMIPTTTSEYAGSWEKGRQLCVGEEEEKEVLRTELAPRLRSNSEKRGTGDNVVLKARKSIVLRDRKAAALAREGNTKRPRLVRPVTSPTTPTFQRPNSKPTRGTLSGFNAEILAIEKLKLDTPGEVRRLGKGLAFNPNPRQRTQTLSNSLPGHKRSLARQVVDVPPDITRNLVSTFSSHPHRDMKSKENMNSNRAIHAIKSRLTSWSIFCRPSTSTSCSQTHSSTSSFGNL